MDGLILATIDRQYGCHVLDGAYWALELDHPTSIEMEEVRGGSVERYPTGQPHPMGFPAQVDHPPSKLTV